jgi:hypothetical protein
MEGVGGDEGETLGQPVERATLNMRALLVKHHHSHSRL